MMLTPMILLYYLLNYNRVEAITGGLKWVKVTVPPFRATGETAELECDYDLGNDTLYSVKWYKDHEEFYRFVPKARPVAHSFKVEGVSVIMKQSNSKKVVLTPVNIKTSGLFRCEVSAEAPSFTSRQDEDRMEVLYMPKENPSITGVEEQYQIGDEINLNCTSGRSYPPSALHWFINEEKVTSNTSLIHYPLEDLHLEPISVTLGLRFTLSSRHFEGGFMKVKCVASVLWRGDRESVQNLPIKHMREALLLVTSSRASNLSQATMAAALFCTAINVALLLQ